MVFYSVKAKYIEEKMGEFYQKLIDGTIKNQKPDGPEIVNSMKRAKITARYKDSVRNEIFETLESRIFIEESTVIEEHSFPFLSILGPIAGVGVLTFMIKKRNKIKLRNIPKSK